MGSDILDNLNKWLYPNIIAQNIHIAVISRPGYVNSFKHLKSSISWEKT